MGGHFKPPSMSDRVKEFKCTLCDKCFTLEANFKKHEFKHTGKKPFSCEFCGDSFMQVAQLKTHSLKKHNEIRKRTAKFTKKTLKKEETLETFAPTEFTDNYRVSKVKLDETKQLFRTENIKRYFLIISYFQ